MTNIEQSTSCTVNHPQGAPCNICNPVNLSRGIAGEGSVKSLVAKWMSVAHGLRALGDDKAAEATDECAAELANALIERAAIDCEQDIDDPADQGRGVGESRESRMVVVERDAEGTPTVWCDPEIVDLVTALNKGGIPTVASCSGHGVMRGNIALRDGRELHVSPNFESARGLEAALTQPKGDGYVPGEGEVLVTVSGLTGSGKSGVAGEIEILCKALGLQVEWKDSEEEKFLTHADWTQALELYKPRVTIIEQNIPRTPK